MREGKLMLEELKGAGLEEERAEELWASLQSYVERPADECWARVSRVLLEAAVPFEVHRAVYESVYAGWDGAHGPPPAWVPGEDFIETTNIHRFMRAQGIGSYAKLHAWSVSERERFWEKTIEQLGIRFRQPWSCVRDPESGVEEPRWLVGARMNIVDSCFAADPETTAVVYQPEGESPQEMSYGGLRRLVDRVACSLVELGYGPGDAIGVDLPMTVESVAVYLGIVAMGGVVVGIADSMAAGEIETRLRLGGAKGIFTQDKIGRGARRLPLYEKVVEANAPRAIVLPCDEEIALPLRDGDLSWEEFLVAEGAFTPVERAPEDRVNILFSSGTTGDPKAIPWTQTTPIKCAADGWFHHDIRPGYRVAWPTSLGWMMGPWLIFASLINRATIALSYGPPGGHAFGRFVRDARVDVLGVVPSLVKIWRNTSCMEEMDWSHIKAFSSTGECSNPEDMLYLMRLAGYRPIIEYCGGTEIGGGYITGTMVQPASPATFSTPALGIDVHIFDEKGEPEEQGELFLVPPSIGLSTELIGADHHEVYFADTPAGPDGERLRRHGDEMERLGGRYYRAHGRVDDTMNLHGIKVSSSEIERVAATVEGVHEAAAVAVPPAGGGPDELILYVVLQEGVEVSARALHAALQKAIRTRLSNLFRVAEIVPVESLPRTASNKIMRRVLRRKYVEGRDG